MKQNLLDGELIFIVAGRIPITVGCHDNLREIDYLLISRKIVLDIRQSTSETDRNGIPIRCNNTGLSSILNSLITDQISIGTKLMVGVNGTDLFWNIGIVVENSKYKANHSIQISFNDSTKRWLVAGH